MNDYNPRSLIDVPVHPGADIFPLLDEDAITNLENDIKLNGQVHPIVVWNGQIVDGRNRYVACVRAGIKPRTKDMVFASNADCIRFIISLNLNRRHLSDEQRDQIGARLVTMQAGANQWSPQNAGTSGVGVADAAELVHSTPARIERARTIERADPKLAERVISGEISKGKALKEIRERVRVKPQTDPDQAAVEAPKKSAYMARNELRIKQFNVKQHKLMLRDAQKMTKPEVERIDGQMSDLKMRTAKALLLAVSRLEGDARTYFYDNLPAREVKS